MKTTDATRREDIFHVSAAVVFITAAIAKIWLVIGEYPVTKEYEPIFGWKFGQFLVVAGLMEGACAGLLLWGKNAYFKRLFLAALCLVLVLYRTGLWWLDYHLPCSCLGVLPEWLGLSRSAGDILSKILLLYLVLGSLLAIIFGERGSRARPQEFRVR